MQWADNLKGIEEDVMELKEGSQSTPEDCQRPQGHYSKFVNFSQAVAEATVKHLGRPVQQIGQNRRRNDGEGEANKRTRIEEGDNIHPSQHQEARC